MKKLHTVILTMALTVFAVAEDNKSTFNNIVNGLEFGPIASIETTDFDDDWRAGYGMKANYFLLENLGVQTEILRFDNDSSFVDRQTGNLLFKAPLDDNFALIPFGGLLRNYEEDRWGFNVGLRAEVQIWNDLYLDAGGRWLREEVISESKAQFDIGLKYSF